MNRFLNYTFSLVFTIGILLFIYLQKNTFYRSILTLLLLTAFVFSGFFAFNLGSFSNPSLQHIITDGLFILVAIAPYILIILNKSESYKGNNGKNQYSNRSVMQRMPNKNKPSNNMSGV